MINIRNLTAAVVVSVLSSSAVLALPDARSGNPLHALGINVPEGVGEVTRDHELVNTLHVGPTNFKEIEGTYFDLGDNGATCEDFSNIRSNAYWSPAREDMDDYYASGQWGSNYYQLLHVLPRKNTDLIARILTAFEAVSNWGEVNKDKIANYKALNSEWIYLSTIVEAAENELNELQFEKTRRDNNCIINFIDEPLDLRNCLRDNAVWFATDSQSILDKIAYYQSLKDGIRSDYFAAKAEYDAVEEEKNQLITDLNRVQIFFMAQTTVLNSAWQIEKDIVNEEANKIVGMATVGYNLFDNEVNLLAQALQGHGNFEINQLDVFNVALNSGVTFDNPVLSVGKKSLFSKNVWSYPASTLVNTGVLAEWQMPFNRGVEEDVLYIDTMDKNSFAAGSFNSFVTKGVKCGTLEKKEREYVFQDSDGKVTTYKVTENDYVPNTGKAVFAQSVGLSYNYYAYPGPVEGECSLGIDKTASYWRDTGKSKRWRWFRSETSSWDIIRESAKTDMDMVCTVSTKPSTGNPVEDRRLAEEFEKEIYSDMWETFLIMYAESFDVEVHLPDIDDPIKGRVGEELGMGVLKHCRHNVICSFGNVVLKTLDAIGGTKAQGKIDSKNAYYGKINRRFKQDSFTVKQGNAVVSVIVRLP